MSIYYGVICKACGPVELTKAQYMSQLSAAAVLWKCPKCERVASWDDTRHERSCADHWAATAQAAEQKRSASPLVAADLAALEKRLIASLDTHPPRKVPQGWFSGPLTGREIAGGGLLGFNMIGEVRRKDTGEMSLRWLWEGSNIRKSSPLGYQPEAE